MYLYRIFSNLRFFILILPVLLLPSLSSSAESSESRNSTITAINGISVGHYTDTENLKGCTVIRFTAEGATAAVDVRGSAPGTRETDLLDPKDKELFIGVIGFDGKSITIVEHDDMGTIQAN